MKAIACTVVVALALVGASCNLDAPVRPAAPTAAIDAPDPVAGDMPTVVIEDPGTDRRDQDESRRGQIRLNRIGHPIWKPVDFQVFTAPIGTASDGYAGFANTAFSMLPEPNHAFHPDLLVGPGSPHAPPYDAELTRGLAANDYPSRRNFSVAEFSNGQAVYVVWMNVAHPGTTGSSPDFASGPIIPHSLFPIHVAGTAFRNGRVWDPFLGTFDVPALNAVNPPFNVDGHSHFPLFFADNMDFAPPNTNATGDYEFRVRMTDTSGNGWDIRARFKVSNRRGDDDDDLPM